VLKHQSVETEKKEDFISDPFKLIDNYIQNEALKESYCVTPERYGTVDDYMEVTL
jgi:hypothetical protein